MASAGDKLRTIGLDQLGITSAAEICYNLSYDELFRHETASEAQGFERGVVTKTGAVAVDTGRFTGRSPKDKYMAEPPSWKKTVFGNRGGPEKKPLKPEVWNELKKTVLHQ